MSTLVCVTMEGCPKCAALPRTKAGEFWADGFSARARAVGAKSVAHAHFSAAGDVLSVAGIARADAARLLPFVRYVPAWLLVPEPAGGEAFWAKPLGVDAEVEYDLERGRFRLASARPRRVTADTLIAEVAAFDRARDAPRPARFVPFAAASAPPSQFAPAYSSDFPRVS